jgi:hypothetical protein
MGPPTENPILLAAKLALILKQNAPWLPLGWLFEVSQKINLAETSEVCIAISVTALFLKNAPQLRWNRKLKTVDKYIYIHELWGVK